jgi:hypothetical protein
MPIHLFDKYGLYNSDCNDAIEEPIAPSKTDRAHVAKFSFQRLIVIARNSSDFFQSAFLDLTAPYEIVGADNAGCTT